MQIEDGTSVIIVLQIILRDYIGNGNVFIRLDNILFLILHSDLTNGILKFCFIRQYSVKI